MDEVQGLVLRAEQIQDALWAQATIMGERPTASLTGFVQSLTVLTDLQIKRLRAAVWNRLPEVIVLALAFSSVIVLIVDLERPRQRLFTVSQEPMADVVRRIQPARQP